ALEIVFSDWLGIGRQRHIDIGSLAPCRFDQLIEVLHLVGRLARREVESAPSVSILGDALERRAAFAAEPYRHFAANGLGVAANVVEFDELSLVAAMCVAPER